jgi:hypothetical protein
MDRHQIARYRTNMMVNILAGIRDKYRNHVIWGLWHKRGGGGGRYYVEVDIKGDLTTARRVVEELFQELDRHGIWYRQLGPLKSVFTQSGDKLWRLCMRTRVFAIP